MDQSFTEQTYLPSLQRLQNEDGGWGFTAGCESRVEPTAWALLALQEFSAPRVAQSSMERGLRYLIGRQLENGAWPAVSGDKQGCWVTSLACWALVFHEDIADRLGRGLRWLIDDRPRDSGFLWRVARKLADRKKAGFQDSSLHGWSWTPRTASWVEPTSYALIVQRCRAAQAVSPDVLQRCQVAEAMLYDRMCPGGGWNCGNPRVYGVGGQPQIGPTAWALIALREHSHRPENQLSLEWLESTMDKIETPESLSLTIISLGAHGRRCTALTGKLRGMYESAVLSWSVPALAWGALATSETPHWLDVFSANR